ncbi:MAG: hypothetical protein F6J98_32120 [Moorea sp. SIO4G2]|nr:hypothetical protein [Moorena sp. SIO4G2]
MQSASGGNHGKARVGETPKTALPPQDRAASLLLFDPVVRYGAGCANPGVRGGK